MEKIIRGVLGTLLKMSDVEIAEALKKSDGKDTIDEDKVLALILSKDKDRITALKAEGATKWDDAYKAAEKKIWQKVEKTLKDRFDVESDLKGDELVEFVTDTVNEKLSKPGDKKPLTEDEVKKHPIYIAAEKTWKKLVADKETEKTTALDKVTKEFTQKELFAKAKDAALIKFKALGDAILPADAERAARMIDKLLVDELKGYQYEVDDKGKLIALDKEGKRVEDEHGHAVEFDNLVEKIAKTNFEFKASKDRGAPGNENDPNKGGGGGGAKKFTGKAPGTKDEYLGILTSGDFTTEQKMEVKKDYGEQFSKN